jgi:hypothetical protein
MAFCFSSSFTWHQLSDVCCKMFSGVACFRWKENYERLKEETQTCAEWKVYDMRQGLETLWKFWKFILNFLFKYFVKFQFKIFSNLKTIYQIYHEKTLNKLSPLDSMSLKICLSKYKNAILALLTSLVKNEFFLFLV